MRTPPAARPPARRSQGDDPKLLVVFCSDSYDLDAAARGHRRARAGDVPLIGCSTAGEIADRRPAATPASSSPRSAARASRSRTAAATGASAQLREAGAEVAAALAETLDDRDRTGSLLLLTDGLAGDQQEIVRGAYGVVGAGVPLVGGCAGDDLQDDRDLPAPRRPGRCSDAVVGGGDRLRRPARHRRPPRLAARRRADARHRERGQPRLRSSTTGRRSTSTSSASTRPPRPAPTPAAFTRFALTHPLGLGRRSGEEQVRFVAERRLRGPLARLHRRGAAGRARLVHGGRRRLGARRDRRRLRATRSTRSTAATPLGLLAFDCIARRARARRRGHPSARSSGSPSTRAARRSPASTPTARSRARTASSGFHNQTLVVLAVS